MNMKNKPLILVTPSREPDPVNGNIDQIRVHKNYADSIYQAGGVPLIPAFSGEELRSLVDASDGLLLTGGRDVAPRRYGEQTSPECGKLDLWRDELEWALIDAFIQQKKPTVLFLISGGGSSLFEKPLIPLEELQSITEQLLASGADIVEMNTIRKRLSAVKGGRFALHCVPAQVYAVILSDILGDPMDMIASGPACVDPSTCNQALEIAEKYQLKLSPSTWELLQEETPKVLDNVAAKTTGSVRMLCTAAAQECRALGYEPVLLTDRLCCEAVMLGVFSIYCLYTRRRRQRSRLPCRRGNGRAHQGARYGWTQPRACPSGGTRHRRT